MSSEVYPDILFILADDMGAWALGCAGNPEIRTPNLDWLAARGVRLPNAFCVSPVCSPARASLLTGKIPSNHGVHDWIRRGNTPGESSDGAVIDYLAGQLAYTEVLAQRGYTIGLSGKWHLGNAATPQKGHTFWQVHARGGGAYYGGPMIRDGREVEEPRYMTEVITDNALAILRDRPKDRPIYLGVHYTAPHSPWDRDQHPAELYDSYFNQCEWKSTPDLPLHPEQIYTAPLGDTPEHRRECLSGYYAAITAMDAQIGRLIEELRTNGRLDQTMIVFTSDNGMNMGHHGIWGKGNGTFPQNMFDTSVKVPFLISWPKILPAGRVDEALFSHYDFFPTLLALLGMPEETPAGIAGRDFSWIWQDGPTPKGEEVFLADEYGPVRMIRTREWKYIHRYPDGPNELYHLASDPDETQNRVNDPELTGQVESLKCRLEGWFERHSRPAFDGRNQPVTGMGQLDRLDSGGTPLFGGPAVRVQK